MKLRVWGMVVVSIAGGLALAEVGATIYVQKILHRGKTAIFDPVLGWSNRPAYDTKIRNPDGRHILWKTDADGWRLPVRLDADAATRVLIVGDSFVAGAGVQASERLDALFKRALPNTSVGAVGVGGWGTDQQLLAAQPFVSALSAGDTFVLVANINDFYDVLRKKFAGRRKPFFRIRDGKLIYFPIEPSIYDWLRDNFYIVSFITHFIERFDAWPERAELTESIEIFSALVEKYVEPLRKRGVRVVVAYHGFLGRSIAEPPTHANLLRNSVRETCRRLRFDCIDLDPILLGEPDGEIFQADGHWKPRGYKLVADALLPLVTVRLGTSLATP